MESCQISLHLREESKDSLGEGGPPPKMGEWRKNTEYPKKVSLMMEVQGKISDVGMMSAEMKR